MATDVKVTRDGTVTVDGKTVGRVEKRMEQRGFAYTESAVWYPVNADGVQLGGRFGCDTRKKAADLVARDAQPFKADGFKVERDFSDSASFVSGWVTYRGHTFGVSRYATEQHWIVDYYAAPGAFCPTFSNGSGSRCTRAQVIGDEYADRVTAAAVAAGVWPMAGVR
jgi:hypothetical protein